MVSFQIKRRHGADSVTDYDKTYSQNYDKSILQISRILEGIFV